MNKWYNPKLLAKETPIFLELIHNLRQSSLNEKPNPSVQPFFFQKTVEKEPPVNPVDFQTLYKELEENLYKGVKKLNHPFNFAAFTEINYYLGDISDSTIVSEIFANAFHSPGFSWESSPAQTELENIVMDWLVELFKLPEKFRIKNEGGGSISTSTTHTYFHSVNVAKQKKLEEKNVDFTSEESLKLVAYYPEINEKRVSRALNLKEILHKRPISLILDEKKKNFHLDIDVLESQIKMDIEKGLIPFWCDCSYGSDEICNFDDVAAISKICEKYNIFLNVNANWGGMFLSLPNFLPSPINLQAANFFIVNGRFLDLGGYSSFMFFDDKKLFSRAVGGTMSYPIVQIDNKISDVMHMKDFNMGFGKRFNSYKAYFTIRKKGAKGIREFLKRKIDLAQIFLNSLDLKKFEIVENNFAGTVGFCLRANLEEEKKKLDNLIKDGYLGSRVVGGKEIYIFCINSTRSDEKDVIEFVNKLN